MIDYRLVCSIDTILAKPISPYIKDEVPNFCFYWMQKCLKNNIFVLLTFIHCQLVVYYRKYGTCKRCNGCQRPVFPGHWMRESKDMIYHLTCFCCVVCKRQLSTGEEYGLSTNEVYCLLHFNELLADPHERGN